LSDKNTRTSFFKNLQWDSETQAWDWIAATLKVQDTEQWWQLHWKNQGRQLTPLKLGFDPMTDLAYKIETSAKTKGKLERLPVIFSEQTSIVNPWFGPWFRTRSEKNPNEWGSVTISDIQNHRSKALEWFSQWELLDPTSDQDLLVWRNRQEDWRKEFPKGPVRSWFDSASKR
jgi:hypothetical protein